MCVAFGARGRFAGPLRAVTQFDSGALSALSPLFVCTVEAGDHRTGSTDQPHFWFTVADDQSPTITGSGLDCPQSHQLILDHGSGVLWWPDGSSLQLPKHLSTDCPTRHVLLNLILFP